MKIYIYFKDIHNLDECRKAYRKLARQYHPDFNNGDDSIMKIINNEFDSLIEFQNFEATFKEQKFENNSNENDNKENNSKESNKDFTHIVNDFIDIDDIDIELRGIFIWISGNTKPIKDRLKNHGFEWGSKSQSWYKKPSWYRFENKKSKLDSKELYKDKTKKLKTSKAKNLLEVI